MEQPVPPKRLKNQLVHLDHNLKAIERQQYAGIQRADDALPVLEAFQRFLDNERARMRRRLVAVTVTLLLLVGIGVAAGLIAIYMLSDAVTREQASNADRVRELAGAVTASQTASEAALVRLRDELTRAREALHTDQAVLGASQSNIVASVSAYQASLAAIQKLASGLQADNAKLAVDLAAMTARWPDVSNRVAELEAMQLVPQASDVSAPPTPREVPAPVNSRGGAAPSFVAGPTVGLAIVPQGQTHPVRWQLPSVTPE